jgi:hypothetical protein
MNKADIIYLEIGDVDAAISLWSAQLQFLSDQIHHKLSNSKQAKSERKLSQLARKSIEIGLKLFYACLANFKLDSLLSILNSFYASSTNSKLYSPFSLTPASSFKTLEPPKPLPRVSFSTLHVTKSLARFMAIYLTNQAAAISICTVSNARPMPSLAEYKTEASLFSSSRIALVKEKFTRSLSKSKELANFMTVDKTLELFLCTGLFDEAIYFLNEMNDWKSSFLLNSMLKNSAYFATRTLPEGMSCEAALIDKVITLLGIEHAHMMEKDQAEATHLILKELLVCSVLTRADILEPLLSRLLELLFVHIERMSDASVLVPDGFYLPAPPIYCAQMYSEDSRDDDEAAIEEAVARMKLCSVVRAVLTVLVASNLHSPLIKWYLEQLNEASAQMNEKLGVENLWRMRDSLNNLLRSLRYQKLGYIPESVFALFRDFCALLFYVDLRDRFSLSLRQYKKHFIIFQNQGLFFVIN